jgi:hypothetical protein
MADSYIEFARNFLIATDVNASGIHTLKFIAGEAGTDSYVELGRNPKIATDVIQIPVDELAGL